MSADLDIRLLRAFVAVAEELHFSRAARRLHLAQQALSRDIARLETTVGAKLIDRTTRRVALTPAGERLLTRARQLITLHDDLLRDLRHGQQPVFVDVTAPATTPARIVAAARDDHPELEFFVRYHAGLGEAVPLLTAGRLDATFGRHGSLTTTGISHRLVRWEPLALLLPDDHPLATLPQIPLAALEHQHVCWSTGDLPGHEWRHAVHQLLTTARAVPTEDHPHIGGPDEIAHHLHQRRVAAVVPTDRPPITGTVQRPLTDPVPVYPWSMIWRAEPATPGIQALTDAADRLSRTERWLDPPTGCWMPDPEALTTRSGQ